jgi:hypothetical protein
MNSHYNMIAQAYDEYATMAQADREYADNVGAQRRDVCWILSDRDVWYRNPYYKGSVEPHPEASNYED